MNSVIKDVVFRTNGELYIGVVGSVRSGKSTFIRKFVDTKVVPFIKDEQTLNKLIDDLPQSSEGKTIMTVEPKFVPSNTAYITIESDINLNVRLVDCVGYVIPSSKGYLNDEGEPRLVKTPWKNEEIAFAEAAELGTKKVIENHSHIGVVITSDGSFGEFTRSEYEDIEEKIVYELKELNKPFVIVLNTASVNEETKKLAEELSEKYDVKVIPVNVDKMDEDDIDDILRAALDEFDITKLDINVPNWLKDLDDSMDIKKEFNELLESSTGSFRKFKHINKIKDVLSESRLFASVVVSNLDSATGEVCIELDCNDELYNEILESLVGEAINDKGEFILLLQEAMKCKKELSSYQDAIVAAKNTGYGIAVPKVEDMVLDTPEVIKQGGRYGVKLKAIAPSIHMIKVDVESSFEPIIGTEEQSKSLIEQMKDNYSDSQDGLWNSTIFGRKLSDVVNDGVKAKLYQLDEVTQYKFRESLEKVVNKGRGGIICFVL